MKSQLDGPGLLLDFHGQTHAGNRTELGYAISSDLIGTDIDIEVIGIDIKIVI